jgi:drug/metabolite transporter (DMT)-like permease
MRPSELGRDAARRGRRAAEFVPGVGAALLWGWGPVLISLLARARFDPYTQNLYRYTAAAAVFMCLAALVDRKALLRALRAWPRFVPPACAVATFQTAWVMGIYRTTATVGAFVEHSSLLFGVLGGAALYAEEREVVKSPRFLVSAAAVATGFSGVILGRAEAEPTASAVPGEFGEGVALLLLGAVAWGAYALLVRRAVGRRSGEGTGPSGLPGPVSSFAVTVLIATFLLGAVAAVRADLAHLARVEPREVALLFASGAVCVGAGQVLYFYSIRLVGVAVSQLVTLAAPFFTGLIGLLVLAEAMTATQWLSGALLVGGVAHLMLARRPPGAPAGAAPD